MGFRYLRRNVNSWSLTYPPKSTSSKSVRSFLRVLILFVHRLPWSGFFEVDMSLFFRRCCCFLGGEKKSSEVFRSAFGSWRDDRLLWPIVVSFKYFWDGGYWIQCPSFWRNSDLGVFAFYYLSENIKWKYFTKLHKNSTYFFCKSWNLNF